MCAPPPVVSARPRARTQTRAHGLLHRLRQSPQDLRARPAVRASAGSPTIQTPTADRRPKRRQLWHILPRDRGPNLTDVGQCSQVPTNFGPMSRLGVASSSCPTPVEGSNSRCGRALTTKPPRHTCARKAATHQRSLCEACENILAPRLSGDADQLFGRHRTRLLAQSAKLKRARPKGNHLRRSHVQLRATVRAILAICEFGKASSDLVDAPAAIPTILVVSTQAYPQTDTTRASRLTSRCKLRVIDKIPASEAKPTKREDFGRTSLGRAE